MITSSDPTVTYSDPKVTYTILTLHTSCYLYLPIISLILEIKILAVVVVLVEVVATKFSVKHQ